METLDEQERKVFKSFSLVFLLFPSFCFFSVKLDLNHESVLLRQIYYYSRTRPYFHREFYSCPSEFTKILFPLPPFLLLSLFSFFLTRQEAGFRDLSSLCKVSEVSILKSVKADIYIYTKNLQFLCFILNLD